ncbi:E3 ubiquitin-protein ligase HECTD1-like [Diaphorina citri]|uniref:E3 ubiquitin-protein ligase HECTD1-like n=1 Tax=Diaphorina citri TaxID=121845 RepID=A0A1S4EA60_DIACI|nr:E3 ubiquitin-protein ligase HECTD1-like [Diaphorina citri]
MTKAQAIFLDHFARLGIFSKVLQLAGGQENGTMAKAVHTEPDKTPDIDPNTEDVREILQGKAYHWKEWCLVRGRDCLYVWSDVAALELSNGSNGWFRFILDGKLSTMYSSGSPEGGSDSSGKARSTESITAEGELHSIILHLVPQVVYCRYEI